MSVRQITRADPNRTTDVVGDLVGLDAGTAVIESRHGPVEVPLGAIVSARLAPPSTRDELDLEAIGARALRPAESEPLDGWILRADHGFTRRANSVLALRQLRRPLADALAAASAWYAARGLPLQIHLPLEARRLLDAELAERGWASANHVAVYVRRLDAVAAPPEVEVRPEPSEEWLRLYREGHGTTPTGRALLTRHDRVGFAELRRGGKVLAVGRGAVDEGWLGVMAVEVAPDVRRQGLARAVMAGLGEWGLAAGAARAHLQVSADNDAAVALYESLGYWRHHEYHYRVQPAS